MIAPFSLGDGGPSDPIPAVHAGGRAFQNLPLVHVSRPAALTSPDNRSERLGLGTYPDILDEALGAGASALELIPCVLNVLPMSVPERIDGIYFTDAASLLRLFQSPTFNATAGRRDGANAKSTITSVPAHRLWAGSEICADDLLRQLQRPIQLELMLQQISSTPSGVWLANGTFAITTPIFHQTVPKMRIAGMLGIADDGSAPDNSDDRPDISDGGLS